MHEDNPGIAIAAMEGPLSKWTNVVHGWQYRWFVLGDDALLYYTSKEKMLKGQQRGCLRLRGAIVGIDGENNSLFTITVDGKVFHLQGRDQKERDEWVRALDASIRACCAFHTPAHAPAALRAQLTQACAHLAAIEEQVPKLEAVREQLSDKEKKTVDELLTSSGRFIDVVNRAVILLQMAQSRIECATLMDQENKRGTTNAEKQPRHVAPPTAEKSIVEPMVAPISYSSSDDEFYDAEEDEYVGEEEEEEEGKGGDNRLSSRTPADTSLMSSASSDKDDELEDYDAIYNMTEETDVGDMQQQHGSVIMHLLSQVSIGMDLTKVTLPTFILERRSLLEMYADFFAHPDAFVQTPTLDTPEERFVSVVRYYLGAFYAARKSGVAKKPYNPILGETFSCKYSVPGMSSGGKKTSSGPFPGSDVNELTFFAEQVSHHPPVSAFYAEHPSRKISFHAQIWTKSSFLGLSIGVANIGSGRVILHDLDEEYVLTFPSGYGRSIMSTPWVELGGKVKVTCEKTGYYAEIDFLTKPFIGGKPHRISGELFKQGHKKPFLTVKGEWNNVLYAKRGDGQDYVFVDVKTEKEMKKQCVPVLQQGDRESRKLWRHVTVGLLRNKISKAANAKREIEQRQRDEAKERAEKGEKWVPLKFAQDAQERWYFKEGLTMRKAV